VQKKRYEGISLVENGSCAFYLVATPSKTVVPATEANIDFVVFMQQWVCHWMHSLNAVQALSLV
jgi:hypothetical protein